MRRPRILCRLGWHSPVLGLTEWAYQDKAGNTHVRRHHSRYWCHVCGREVAAPMEEQNI